ncbi:SGNH hydrolase domain-containing protein, partial [Ideonella livida]
VLALASLGLLALAAAGAGLRPPAAVETAAQTARRPNTGLGAACDQSAPYRPLPACDQPGPGGAPPATLVWGDSLAMHLVPGLARRLPGGLRQATQSSCGPLLGLAPLSDAGHTPAWARQCQAFNEGVLAHLATRPDLRRVVLASAYRQYLVPQDLGRHWTQWRRGPQGDEHTGPVDPAAAVDALVATVQAVQALGREVVVVAPPPLAEVDTGRCLARQEAGRWTLGLQAGEPCAVDLAADARLQAPVRALLDGLRARLPQVQVVDLRAAGCPPGSAACPARLPSGTPLYRDARHLSVEGSQALAAAQRWERWAAP